MLFLASLLAFIVPASADTASTAGSSPDLCADVYLGEDGAPVHDSTGGTLSRHCEWTGPDAPRLDGDVCCELDTSGARCSLPNARGECEFGDLYWCEYGEANSLGGVVCYQPLPDACEAGYCVAPTDDPTPTGEPIEAMCCGAGGCFPAKASEHCEGEFLWCRWGISNTDGTVECFD
ncbi:hypothetical protein ENSA5_64770 [Enhygromyxa salina]|uniref:Uncharacterized protein n=2 Tax=Enhygromyxa salina TaxID=215803 RepID=A0A2S9XC74_9BACT|nr:hypothetical protein ENSA5_64770 [Enhygromyxa salina]